jgi:molecular chaperone IbpA
VRTGGENFRISLAVAGFTPGDIAITAQQNLLTIVGRKVAEKEGADYLYKGISAKAFEQRFNLADHVEVESASFDNGLLIDLVQRIPEAMKPRRIEVRAPSGVPSAVGPKAAQRTGPDREMATTVVAISRHWRWLSWQKILETAALIFPGSCTPLSLRSSKGCGGRP